jgi:hypothetical protein
MSALDAVCRWVGVCVALATFCACAGSPSKSAALPNVALTQQATNQDLLYLSDVAANDVKVYSFPQGRLVGTLTGFGKPRSECADAAGNVWIADIEGFDVVEYAHGGTAPIASLSTFGPPLACSVDATGHNLAVAGGISSTIVSIYHKGSHGRWRDATRYSDSAIGVPYFCGYDSRGNLFLDGLTKSKGGRFALAELPRGSKNFQSIAVSQKIAVPAQVQWDGKHLAIGDSGVAPSVVYQFSIKGSNATEVGKTTLDGTDSVRQFWIASGTLAGPDFNGSAGLWRYPAGGSPTKTIAGVHSYGAAVSLAAGQSR